MNKKEILKHVEDACFLNDKENQLREYKEQLDLKERKIVEGCSHPLSIFLGTFKCNSVLDKEEYMYYCPFCLKELDSKDLGSSQIIDLSLYFRKVFEEDEKQEQLFTKVIVKERARQIIKTVIQPYIISLFSDLENIPILEEVNNKVLTFCQEHNFSRHSYLLYIEEVSRKRNEVVSLMKKI